MAAPTTSPALGRPGGKYTTDSNGLARYSLAIDLPAGIGHGNEPKLAFEYAQGLSNGLLGMGWSLGGLSTISRGQVSPVRDGKNNSPGQDRTGMRLLLDGRELLNIEGLYGASGCRYRTEIDDHSGIVTHSESTGGFTLTDAHGRTSEYGTSIDSRLTSSGDSPQVFEWALKRTTDMYGNDVTYNYVAAPANVPFGQNPDLADTRVLYLDNIVYGSNSKKDLKGRRKVAFAYRSRPDPIVYTTAGGKAIRACALAAVNVLLEKTGVDVVLRSYQLDYKPSSTSGRLLLTKIWEQSETGNVQLRLDATQFEYTQLEASAMLEFEASNVQKLSNTRDNVALLPLKISGRGTPDLACIRINDASGDMSVKTYLAESLPSSGVTWAASTSQEGEQIMPSLMRGLHPTDPIIRPVDANGDGRVDLIVPYQDSNRLLHFCTLQSSGTGYLKGTKRSTTQGWQEKSRFLTTNFVGDGQVDMIHIFEGPRSQLSLSILSSVEEQGSLNLSEPETTDLKFAFEGSLDWLIADTQRNGTKVLVRVWSEDAGAGQKLLKITSFQITRNTESKRRVFEPITTIECLKYDEKLDKPSAIVCDVNGDGVQDVVICTRQEIYKGANTGMQFTFHSFLSDGEGSFVKHSAEQVLETDISSAQTPTDNGKFYVTNFHGTDYPCVAFVYQEKTSHHTVALVARGASDGLITSLTMQSTAPGSHKTLQYTKLVDASSLPGKGYNTVVMPIDIQGSGIDGWLCYAIDGDTPYVMTVRNKMSQIDQLREIRDPLGLSTTITYSPLSSEGLYESGIDWKAYPPQINQSHYAVVSAPSEVVTTIVEANIPSINAIPFSRTTRKSYGHARYNAQGRGWQGFAQVHTYDVSANITVTDHYAQDWPCTTQKVKIETAEGPPDRKNIVSTQELEVKAAVSTHGGWNIYDVQKIADRVQFWDNGQMTRSYQDSFEYDNDGNVVLHISGEQDAHKTWTRYAWASAAGATALPGVKKVSSRVDNRNLDKFEDGDLALTTLTYEQATGKLSSVSEWSSDLSTFVTKKIQCNDYGNEVVTVHANGLEEHSEYDSEFKTYPVKVTWKAPTTSDISHFFAHDEKTGRLVFQTMDDGAMTAHELDVFGRHVSSYVNVTKGELASATIAASKCVDLDRTVLSSELKASFQSLRMCRMRSTDMSSLTAPNGQSYICSVTKKYHDDNGKNIVQTRELIDAVGRPARTSVRRGGSSWQSNQIDFDTCGNRIRQTPQVDIGTDDTADLTWTPDDGTCIHSTYDSLNRLTSETKPSARGGTAVARSNVQYLRGGSTVVREVRVEDGRSITAVGKSTVQVTRVNDKDQTISMTNEDNDITYLTYNGNGNVLSVTNAAGQVESRAYNAHGLIKQMTDPYRGSTTRKYDSMNRLQEEVNALGHKTCYEYDLFGRLSKKSGHQGRVIEYSYVPTSKFDKPSQITVFATGQNGPAESVRKYEYDERGNRISESLQIGDGDQLVTKTYFDRQGLVIAKTLPDQTQVSYRWEGNRLSSTTYEQQSLSPSWSVTARFGDYDAYGRPQETTLVGAGALQGVDFTHSSRYNTYGLPISHQLRSGSVNVLVHDQLFFDDLDRLVKSHEVINNQTTEHAYQCGRLSSTDRSSDPVKRLYQYEKGGNLVRNGSSHLTYTGPDVNGTSQTGEQIHGTFDVAGFMTQRSIGSLRHSFAYDDFGQLTTVEDQSNQSRTTIISDHAGMTLCKTLPNGQRQIKVDANFEITINTDGVKTFRRRLYGPAGLLATVHTEEQPKTTAAPASRSHAIGVCFSDIKGSITHVFDGHGVARYTRDYDDWGVSTAKPAGADHDSSATYETKCQDEATGLLDFGARWYDPVLARFTSADDITDEGSLLKTDGMNRFCFENNDPINNVDPTGHWSWGAVFAVVLGIILILAAVVITVATGGAGGILLGAAVAPLLHFVTDSFNSIVGAALGAGIASFSYGVQHRDEQDMGKFFKGWAVSFVVGAVIGAVTGAASAAVASAETAAVEGAAGWLMRGAQFIRCGSRAAQVFGTVLKMGIGAFEGVMLKLTSNGVEILNYDRKDVKWTDGLAKAAGMGAGVAGVLSAGKKAYAAFKDPPITAYEKLVDQTTTEGLAPLISFTKAAGKGAVPVLMYTWGQYRHKEAGSMNSVPTH